MHLSVNTPWLPSPASPAVAGGHGTGPARLPATVATSPAQVDVCTLHTVSAAEAAPTASRPSLLATLAIGLSVAASMAGGAAHAATPPPPLALASPAPASESTLQTLIDRLLDGTHGTPESMAKARASLAAVPESALRLLARNGTHIAIVEPGQTPADAGLVKPFDLRGLDDPSLAIRAQEALHRVDRAYAAPLAKLEARVERLQREAPQDGTQTEPLRDARAALERLHRTRDVAARRAVHDATNGRLEPAMTAEAVEMGRLARVSPVSLRDMAEGHGASTATERAEYASLVARLNGDRLEDARRAYGVDESRLPVEERSMMAYDAQLLVPAFQYARETPDGEATRMHVHDVESVAAWREGAVRGQYFGRDALNTVLVRADALGPQEGGHDVLLHELGHAYEDARQTMNPLAFASYAEAREAAFVRVQANPSHPYRGTHAGSAADELGAQTFADAVAHRDAALRKADATWMKAFDAYRGDARCSSRTALPLRAPPSSSLVPVVLALQDPAAGKQQADGADAGHASVDEPERAG